MAGMHDAGLGDLYVDGDGRVWRVVSRCDEPTVTLTELSTLRSDQPMIKSGGVSGFMWSGFRKLEPKE